MIFSLLPNFMSKILHLFFSLVPWLYQSSKQEIKIALAC